MWDDIFCCSSNLRCSVELVYSRSIHYSLRSSDGKHGTIDTSYIEECAEGFAIHVCRQGEKGYGLVPKSGVGRDWTATLVGQVSAAGLDDAIGYMTHQKQPAPRVLDSIFRAPPKDLAPEAQVSNDTMDWFVRSPREPRRGKGYSDSELYTNSPDRRVS